MGEGGGRDVCVWLGRGGQELVHSCTARAMSMLTGCSANLVRGGSHAEDGGAGQDTGGICGNRG